MPKIQELTNFRFPERMRIEDIKGWDSLWSYIKENNIKGIGINGVTRFSNGVFAISIGGFYVKLPNWADEWSMDSEDTYNGSK